MWCVECIIRSSTLYKKKIIHFGLILFSVEKNDINTRDVMIN